MEQTYDANLSIDYKYILQVTSVQDHALTHAVH